MRLKNIELKDLSLESTLRSDVPYVLFQKEIKRESYYSFKEIFDFIQKEKINLDELEEFKYAEIGNVDKNGFVNPVVLDNNDRKLIDEDYYKKIDKGDIINVQEKDILISKVRPNLKKFVKIIEENKNIFYTSAFIHLKPKILEDIIYYALREALYNNLVSIARIGKGYPTISEQDMKYIKFNKTIIDNLKSKENESSNKIKELEEKIAYTRNMLKQEESIINEVFKRNFGFNYDKFYELIRVKNYKTKFSKLSDNPDVRNSVKFHKDAIQYVYSEILRISNKRIKDYISEPMILGKTISPDDYEDGQRYYYISMADIKNYEFNEEEASTVTAEYANKNIDKAVQKGDILLARSGEGTIGKVALLEKDYNAIFADFIIRIRLKDYNLKFAYYYFRSMYFQYMIEINKKGLGNNTNIFPVQIKELPIIGISMKEQERIVKELDDLFEEQKRLKEMIEKYQLEIQEIVKQSAE